MIQTRILFALLNLLLLFSRCQADKPVGSGPGPTNTRVKLTIDTRKLYQTIDHFGASDAWACQFVGNWPAETKNAIADLLFSRDTLVGGKPKGIGLSLWRFNIGAGTAEQGEASGIRDEWRRAESFLNNDDTYNWDKQAGQLWFLQAARQRGVPEFLAFTNSPPVKFTTNHKGFASNKEPNLAADQYGRFAEFLARVVAGIREKTGITFQYLSPVNEPQWDWSDGGQEGTPFFNNQIGGLTRALSAALLTHKLTTQINIAEAGQIDYLYATHNRPGRSDQITAFFQPSSSDYLGNLANLSPAISGHSYFTTSPFATAVAKRKQIAARLVQFPRLKYWMSEYCILGDNEGEIKGSGRDLGIDPAIYIATVIHNDLTQANASAWHWWLALSAYNYKDGLIYVDKNKVGGQYYPSKMLWALGNYSQFIRPGAVRVDAVIDSGSDQFLVSSYLTADQKLVTVCINRSTEDVELEIGLISGSLTGLKGYLTAATAELEPVKNLSPGRCRIPARSITTLTAEVKP